MASERRDVRELRGSRRGETAFVLANGPSVAEHDLTRLQGRLVIGMNASTLLEEQHGFETAYYTVSDARFLTHPQKRPLGTERLAKGTVRVLRDELRDVDEVSLRDSTYYVPVLGKNGFSDDLHRGFYFGCTTSMLAIQLAAHLGCGHIVLLGNDFRYPKGQPRFYPEENPQPPDPFLSIQLWNVRNAYVELRRRGVDMCICTRSSNLSPYVPFRSFEDALRA